MNKSKLIIIAIFGAVVLLVGASVVRCTLVPSENTHEVFATDKEVSFQKEAEIETDAQAGEAFTSAALTLNDYLNTCWVAETSELSLLDGVFIESNGEESKPTYFVIEDATEQNQVITLTVWVAKHTGDTGYQSVIVIDHSKDTPSITSDVFVYSKTYSLAPTEQSAVTIQAITDDLNDYLSATTSEITSVLSTYVTEHLPSAKALSWTGEAYTDYFEGTCVTTFIADDVAATTLSLMRSHDGTLSVL